MLIEINEIHLGPKEARSPLQKIEDKLNEIIGLLQRGQTGSIIVSGHGPPVGGEEGDYYLDLDTGLLQEL